MKVIFVSFLSSSIFVCEKSAFNTKLFNFVVVKIIKSCEIKHCNFSEKHLGIKFLILTEKKCLNYKLILKYLSKLSLIVENNYLKIFRRFSYHYILFSVSS